MHILLQNSSSSKVTMTLVFIIPRQRLGYKRIYNKARRERKKDTCINRNEDTVRSIVAKEREEEEERERETEKSCSVMMGKQ